MAKCYGGSNEDDVSSIQQSSDAGFIFTGGTSSSDDDVSGMHGWGDYWVVKLSGNTGLNTIPDCTEITILPNPTTGDIKIQGIEKTNILVYNILAQLVDEKYDVNNISITNCPAGIYFIRLFDEHGQILKQDKIIKE